MENMEKNLSIKTLLEELSKLSKEKQDYIIEKMQIAWKELGHPELDKLIIQKQKDDKVEFCSSEEQFASLSEEESERWRQVCAGEDSQVFFVHSLLPEMSTLNRLALKVQGAYDKNKDLSMEDRVKNLEKEEVISSSLIDNGWNMQHSNTTFSPVGLIISFPKDALLNVNIKNSTTKASSSLQQRKKVDMSVDSLLEQIGPYSFSEILVNPQTEGFKIVGAFVKYEPTQDGNIESEQITKATKEELESIKNIAKELNVPVVKIEGKYQNTSGGYEFDIPEKFDEVLGDFKKVFRKELDNAKDNKTLKPMSSPKF